MISDELKDAPELLRNFVLWFESDGAILCTSTAEEVACCVRSLFKLIAPMSLPEANEFILSLKDVSFFLQPGLERFIGIRGNWYSFLGKHFVFVEPDRPVASRIKTVFHEIAEQLLDISHTLHPHIKRRNNQKREKWANQFAAFIKMPSEQFRDKFEKTKLDLVTLKEELDDTLAGVARHTRDLVLSKQPFYFIRCDFVPRPERVCTELLPVINKTGGPCVVIKDIVRTGSIVTNGNDGSLPPYNLPLSDHYRVMNPVMHQYIKKSQPVFFSSWEGGASDEGSYADLFGENRLCALIVPYGKQNKGFFLIAVHPKDRHLMTPALERLSCDERGDLPWLFSQARYVRKHKPSKPEQDSLPEIGGSELFKGRLGVKPYPWIEGDEI